MLTLDSLQQQSVILDLSADAILIHDLDDNILFANKPAYESRGYRKEEMSGMKLSKLLAPEQRELFAQRRDELFNKGELRFESAHIRKDGSVFPVETHAKLIEIEGNKYCCSVIRDITDRKLAKEELFDSRQMLQMVLDNIPQRIFWKDRSSIFLGCNKPLALDCGYADPRALIGKTDYETASAANADIYRADDRMVMETGLSKINYEEPQIKPDGSSAWLRTSKVPLRDKDGLVIGVLGMYEDITERKLMEESLRDNAHFLQILMDAIPNPIFYKDSHGVYQGCNAAFEAYLGLDKNKIVGKSVYDISPRELADEYHEMDRELFRRGGIQTYGSSVRYTDGSRHDVIFNKATFTNADGSLGGLIGVILDITELKQAEQRTRDALNFIRTMMESSPIGIVSIKATGAVVTANEAMTRISGGTVDTLLKQNVRHVEAWKKYGLLSAMDEALAANSERHIETYYVSTFGKQSWLSVRFVPYIFEGEPHVLALFADMSDRKLDEAEKEKLQAQLLQAQKMEAVGQLAGGIAHDFNNILTAVIGYGSIALKKMAKDDPNRPNIEQILEASDRAKHLTRDLLLFGRKQRIERRPIDLNEGIQKLGKFLTRVIGEDITFTTTLSGGAIPALADEHQIDQVLMNLATNSRDAMPTGGTFTISTEQVHVDEEFASKHGLAKPGKYALIRVSDTGQGMDEETRQRIFEPFYTTKEVGKGTGLGLAVVYGIVKQHEGCISVSSEPGMGTTFNMYLPVIASGAAEEKAAAAEERPLGGTETILVAEDYESVRNLTVSVLQESGYTVITAVDGEDAVRKYRENKDTVQLLLFDLIMPRKSGEEAYNEIRKMQPDIKILFASGYSPDIVGDKAAHRSVTTLVHKPMSPMDLLRKVRSVLDEGKGNRRL